MTPSSAVKKEQPVTQNDCEMEKYRIKIAWFNVIYNIIMHAGFIYALYLGVTIVKWKTIVFACIYGNISGIGITAGVHRLWCHRSYKAKWPLRVLLCCFFTMASQGTIYNWSRDHRVHHKYTDTDADPYNIKRGFFFAHIGWTLCKKHPAVIRKGKTVFLDDLWVDPIVKFHTKFYLPMSIFFCFILPTMIPVWFWNETVWNSFFIAMARHCYIMNVTWSLNSAGHTYGDQPFDKYMEARDNAFLSFLVHGEGWHNYHHAFPWDYSTSELGYTFNLTKLFIDFMALIGQAYDLKYVLPDKVKNRKLKTGDGTRLK